jgi:hypothetical protein
MIDLGAAFTIICHSSFANRLATRDLGARALAAGIPVDLLDADDAGPRRRREAGDAVAASSDARPPPAGHVMPNGRVPRVAGRGLR